MHRVVLDTNVFVSGAISAHGYPAQILDSWRNQQFILVSSPQIINEISAVIQRPEIVKFTQQDTNQIISFIQEVTQRAYMTAGILTVNIISDPADNMILACAIEGKATHIVTGNTKHFSSLGSVYQGIKIITPHQFIVNEL